MTFLKRKYQQKLKRNKILKKISVEFKGKCKSKQCRDGSALPHTPQTMSDFLPPEDLSIPQMDLWIPQ
ncbi:hypothetical protein SUGI_1176680 [Cryptomeria japonica]|nr:hypothetical protein SUGI_1176680 [Cryptomeria japonica]